MRESIIFLKYNFARFSFGGENDFSMMLSMDKVKKGKRYGDICSCDNTEVSFFLSGYFWQKYKSIGIAKVLYIIFSFKSYGQFSHW